MLSFFPLDVLSEIWDVIESVSEGFLTYSFKFRTFIFTDLFHGYIDMAGYNNRQAMLTTRGYLITLLFLGSRSVYQIIWKSQCLNYLRVWSYDLGTSTTWL